jgi:hypothetical protein
VQKKGSFCGRLSPPRVRTLKYCSELVRIDPPLHLVKGTEVCLEHIPHTASTCSLR